MKSCVFLRNKYIKAFNFKSSRLANKQSIIHNAFSGEKVHPLLFSHINVHKHICLELFGTFSLSLVIQTSWLFFHCRILAGNMSEYENVLMDLFLTNRHLFTLHYINWWTFTSQDVNSWAGVTQIICGLLWCFLSAVWTLNPTAPIHCRGSTGEQVMYISPDEIFRNKLILDGFRVSTFSFLHGVFI